MREIPKWAKSALIDGKFYKRALVPDEWIPEEQGLPILTPKEVLSAKRVSFFA